jgi:hypothetical protein
MSFAKKISRVLCAGCCIQLDINPCFGIYLTPNEYVRDDALFFSTDPAEGGQACQRPASQPEAGKAHGLVIFLLPSARHFRKDIITMQSRSVLPMWSAVEIVKSRPVGGESHFQGAKLFPLLVFLDFSGCFLVKDPIDTKINIYYLIFSN